MAFNEKITLVVDVITGNAKSGLSQVKSDIAAADGAFAKMKAGATSAFGTLKTIGPQAALAAGGALVAFGAKSVQAFQDTALAAGKFADATGLSVESASRFIAVADDVGVSAGSIQGAFVKMQKAIETNRDAFGDLVATTASGGTDLEGTFFNVIQHLQSIEDPIKRANEASRLFGRGFSEIAEIIGTDVDVLKAKFKDVADAQVITKEELEKAREFREQMDQLNEVVGDLALSLGSQLVPIVSDAARQLTEIAEAAGHVADMAAEADKSTGGWLGKVNDFIGDKLNPFEVLADGAERLNEELSKGDDKADLYGSTLDRFEQRAAGVNTQLGYMGPIARDLSGQFDIMAMDIDRAAQAMEDQENAARDLLNAQLAAIDSTFAVSESQRSFTEAVEAANTATDDSATAVNEQQAAYDAAAQAALRVAGATLKYAEDQASLQGRTLSADESQKVLIDTLYALAGQAEGPVATAIGGMITQLQTVGQQKPKPTVGIDDQASEPLRRIGVKITGLDGSTAVAYVSADTTSANAKLDALSRRLSALASTGTLVRPTGGAVPRFQAGGFVNAPKGQPVLAEVHGGEHVLDAGTVDAIKKGKPTEGAATRGMAGTGSVTNIYNFPVGTDPDAVNRAQTRYARRNGSR